MRPSAHADPSSRSSVSQSWVHNDDDEDDYIDGGKGEGATAFSLLSRRCYYSRYMYVCTNENKVSLRRIESSTNAFDWRLTGICGWQASSCLPEGAWKVVWNLPWKDDRRFLASTG